MRVTPSHVLAAQNIGRFVSVLLTLLLVVQPVRVSAESVSGVDVTPTLTVTGEVLKAAPPVQGPERPPTVQQVLLDVCTGRGYGQECAKTLLGIMWKESQNDPEAIGDGGKARGYFQIHYRLHKISLDCAKDLRCSASWTLTYMEHNGYPKYPTYAIQCHNGCGVRNGYAASVLRNASRLWDAPMTVEVALAK